MTSAGEIIKKIRALEIRTRRKVDEVIGGAYHSVFQGRGIEFNEVREYTLEDDSRDIDWNVTARMNAPYVKRYTEERELTVMLLVDVSPSLDFGSGGYTKRDLAVEAAAMLALSAIRNHDKVGLMLFSDRIELFLPPRSGRRHGLRLLREIAARERRGGATDIDRALRECRNLLDKRSVVFLLSDLIAPPESCEVSLRLLNKRHDVVALYISDPAERTLANSCPINLEDIESGERFYAAGMKMDSGDYASAAAALRRQRLTLCRKCGVDVIELSTATPPLAPMVEFFRRRENRRR